MDRLQGWLSDRPRAVVMAVAFAVALPLGLQTRVWGWGETLWVLLLLATGVGAWHAGRRWERLGQESPRLDPSTGLVNAHALFDHVSGEVERAQRYGRPFTLLYLSVDSLPVIREHQGDDGAQDALRRVAHHLKGSLRTVDVVARLREREFAVLLPETGVEAAGVVLSRIRRTLVAATMEDPEEISFAVGASTWLRAEMSVDELHQRTYQLMYAAQRKREVVQHEVLEEGTVETVAHRHLTLRR